MSTVGHSGRLACGLSHCNHDHRPTPLYPGYDGSGFPLTQEQRCEQAAERIYRLLDEVIPGGVQWHTREEIVRRLGAALRGMFP